MEPNTKFRTSRSAPPSHQGVLVGPPYLVTGGRHDAAERPQPGPDPAQDDSDCVSPSSFLTVTLPPSCLPSPGSLRFPGTDGSSPLFFLQFFSSVSTSQQGEKYLSRDQQREADRRELSGRNCDRKVKYRPCAIRLSSSATGAAPQSHRVRLMFRNMKLFFPTTPPGALSSTSQHFTSLKT